MEDTKHLPHEIANIIFNTTPQEPKTIQMFNESPNGDSVEYIDLFEIFLTIMTEGIFIKNNPVTAEKLKMFNETVITSLRPWLLSLGYNIVVDVIPRQKVEEYEKYYCKVIIKADPLWNQYFEILHPEITAEYHYVFGGKSPYVLGTKCTLQNMFAIFDINNVVYKISFNCI